MGWVYYGYHGGIMVYNCWVFLISVGRNINLDGCCMIYPVAVATFQQ